MEQKLTSATGDAENVALLTECPQTTAEDVVFALEFLPGNCWNVSADVVYALLESVRVVLHISSFKLPHK